MFFLAGTACCWSDSYDPDPYDDIPPVVTVDFNYVVPSAVSVRAPKIETAPPQRFAIIAIQPQSFATPQFFLNQRTVSLIRLTPSNLLIPLRR